jgi:hypothetical protein
MALATRRKTRMFNYILLLNFSRKGENMSRKGENMVKYARKVVKHVLTIIFMS